MIMYDLDMVKKSPCGSSNPQVYDHKMLRKKKWIVGVSYHLCQILPSLASSHLSGLTIPRALRGSYSRWWSLRAHSGGRGASELFGENVLNSQITGQLVHYGLDVTQVLSFIQFPQGSGTCAKTVLPQNVRTLQRDTKTADSLERYKDSEDTCVDGWVLGSDCTTQAFMLNTTSGSLSLSSQQTDLARPGAFSASTGVVLAHMCSRTHTVPPSRRQGSSGPLS